MSGQHEPWCQVAAHTDAAKRVVDVYNLHRMADQYGSIGKWIAVALEDGRSDNVLYDKKVEAVRHQKHNEMYYTYIKIVPSTMNVCESEVALKTARTMYAAGMRMTDPDHKHGGMDLITRLTVEDQKAMMRGVVTSLKMPWEAKQ